jgi:hypothetical protein
MAFMRKQLLLLTCNSHNDLSIYYNILCYHPGRARGSLLSEWFSGKAPVDDDGYVFIDRHPEVILTSLKKFFHHDHTLSLDQLLDYMIDIFRVDGI